MSNRRVSGRVARSGGWINDTAHCRPAYRGASRPVLRLNHLGFRVALVPSRQASEPASQDS